MSASLRLRAGLRLALFGWFIVAVAVGRQELLLRLPQPVLSALVLSLTALLVILCRRVTPLREHLDQLDLRWFLIPHLTRFVGIWFLVLHQRGIMPEAFAVPAGWGDIVTAALAGLILILPLAPATRRRAVTIWNAVGLVDLLFVVATAARLTLAGSTGMQVMGYLPLSLLPTFLVPILLASHLVLFSRLAATEASEAR